MHTRKPNRLKHYDYSNSGYYFVTICVNKMEAVFGKVVNEKIMLNNYGKIVEKYLKIISEKYENIELDYYAIMPNHVHAVIIINDINSVGTTHELSLQRKSLSTIIGFVKMNSSRDIHQFGLENFKWQRSFYDRIIRNEKELFNIRKYIEENPLKWEIDKYSIANLDF